MNGNEFYYRLIDKEIQYELIIWDNDLYKLYVIKINQVIILSLWLI